MKTYLDKNKKDEKKDLKPPIILTAFGTTTNAINTYSIIEKLIEKKFPGHRIFRAYSSRMVKEQLTKKGFLDMKYTGEVLKELEADGCQWAIVQSMHLICGHEFYRLIEEVKQSSVRTSIGLPLLTSFKDYKDVVDALGCIIQPIENQAIIFIGHGTDHPAWSSYLALYHMLHEKFGNNVHIGVIEGYPSRDEIINTVSKSNIKKVLLIPLMLIAGRHLLDDIAGDEDSWKTELEKKGIIVSIKDQGLGLVPGIQKIFCRHISDACEMIP